MTTGVVLKDRCYFSGDFGGAGGAFSGGFGASGGFTGVSGGFTVGAFSSGFVADDGGVVPVGGVGVVGFGAVVATGPQPTTNPQARAAVRANTFKRIVVSLCCAGEFIGRPRLPVPSALGMLADCFQRG